MVKIGKQIWDSVRRKRCYHPNIGCSNEAGGTLKTQCILIYIHVSRRENPLPTAGSAQPWEETWMNLTKGRGGNWAFRGDLRAVVEDLILFSLVIDLANFLIGKSTI